MKIKNCFPCLELPPRCYLSTNQNKRISCNREGNIFSTENRAEWEEWYILEDPKSGSIQFRNCARGTFLTCDDRGSISTSSSSNVHEQWVVQKGPGNNNNAYSICSVSSDRYLTCQESGVFCGITRAEDSSAWIPSWRIEYLTGELCFITSPNLEKQLSYHPWSGLLSMSKNRKGWEVWRFIEAGDGHVRIMSWHDGYILCSDEYGKVWTTRSRSRSYKNNAGESDKWDVELTPDGSEGVVFKSVSHGRYLQAKNCGELSTCEFMNGTPAVWHITAANSQQFFLSSLAQDRRIGCNKGGIVSTKNRKDWEVWELHHEDNGFVSLRSRKFGKILSSDQDGNLYQTDHVGQNALWKIEISPTGTLHMVSKISGRYLSSNENGEKFSTRSISHPEASECWSLEPALPSTITGKKMMNLSIGGSVAALSIVAAPFAVMGAVGAMGFGSAGIAGGSMAAGMMSAEAIASGGAIAAGGTVATLQSIGAAGLGVAGTAASMSAGAVVGASTIGISAAASKGPSSMGESTTATATDFNRPFCAWRSW